MVVGKHAPKVQSDTMVVGKHAPKVQSDIICWLAGAVDAESYEELLGGIAQGGKITDSPPPTL
eukprot:COSAG06_NODE_4034_length_4639_cov_77.635711_1_plen_63_part_00